MTLTILQPLRLGLGALALAACGLAQAAGGSAGLVGIGANAVHSGMLPQSTMVVDVTGTPSVGEQGDPSNAVMFVNLGANAVITDIAWTFNVTANDQSWLSEMAVDFLSSDLSAGVTFHPSATTDPGTESGSGTANLDDLGIGFAVGPDGVLRMEFYEDFADPEVTPNGIWNSGSFTISYVTAVPEPGTYGLMALGLLGVGAAARRRRRTMN